MGYSPKMSTGFHSTVRKIVESFCYAPEQYASSLRDVYRLQGAEYTPTPLRTRTAPERQRHHGGRNS